MVDSAHFRMQRVDRDGVIRMIENKGANGQYSPEELILVADALAHRNVFEIEDGLRIVTSAQERLLWWLEGPNTSLDVDLDGIDDYPILERLARHERWDVVFGIVGLMCRGVDEECGDDPTDFMKRFVSLYPVITNGHSDYVKSIDEVGEAFVGKIPKNRRAEFARHVEEVLEGIQEADEDKPEYLKQMANVDT